MYKRVLFIFLISCVVTSVVCQSKPSAPSPTVRIKTNLGNIDVKLNGEKAPISVNNFLGYVKDKAYDGTIFHRVINNFMIQGGGFTEDLEKVKTKAPIKNEADNGLKNNKGTIAMARTNIVDSATNQFFINVNNNGFLNHKNKSPQGYGYAVFGEVVAGQDVVNQIKDVPTGSCGPFSKDCPLDAVVIKTIRVLKK